MISRCLCHNFQLNVRLSHSYCQVIKLHLTFLPHIREAAREVISKLHITHQLEDGLEPPYFVGVHVR